MSAVSIFQGVRMAYFLKKCTKKGRVYLSIVNGYHDPNKGYTVQPKFPGIICNYINSILHYRRKTSVVNYELATYPPAYQNSSGT